MTDAPAAPAELSILDSIKKLLGIDSEYDVFDDEITIHINSVFSVLHQIGAAPVDGFMLLTGDEMWSDFLLEAKHVAMVKTYIYLKVRMLWDPPTSSIAANAFDRNITELEWRLSIMELQWNPHAYDSVNGVVGVTYSLPDGEDFPAYAPDNSIGIDPVTGDVWQEVPE